MKYSLLSISARVGVICSAIAKAAKLHISIIIPCPTRSCWLAVEVSFGSTPLCQRYYRTNSEDVPFTHNDHGHVNFVQPSVVSCGAGSGCASGSETGTGAPMTRAMVAKKVTIKCLMNIVASCTLEYLRLQLEYDVRQAVKDEEGRVIVEGLYSSSTSWCRGCLHFCITGGGELEVSFFVLLRSSRPPSSSS